MADEASREDRARAISPIARWRVCGLLAMLAACNPPPPVAAPDAAPSRDAAHEAVVASKAVTPASVLSREDGVLRVRSDTVAYAPLAQDALNAGDEDAWRQALPGAFARHDEIAADGSSCTDAERIIRFRDAAGRNAVELRGCAGVPPFLAGFSFEDDIVAFRDGLSIGAPVDAVLAALGLPAEAGAGGPALRALEIVNAEDNTTLRLRLDSSRRVRQVEYEPYAG